MKIIHFAVVAMVSLVVISGLMIPMTSAFADEIHSVEFNTAIRYSLAETDERVEMKIENGIGTINGEPILDNYGSRMMMFGDSFIVQYNPTASPHQLSIFTESQTIPNILDIVAEKGVWTAKTSTNTYTGEYELLMSWNKNGNYGAIPTATTLEAYVNSDETIFMAAASVTSSSSLLQSGTIGDLDDLMKSGTEEATITITSEQYTTTPNVTKITSFGSTVSPAALFIPIKYDVITGMDNMTKTMVTLSPLFTGIALFAAMGMGLVRMNKFD